MIMTTNPPPQNITPQGQQIIDFLRGRGDWTTRAQIADMLGKDKLNRWHVGLLDLMIQQGMIEFDRRPRPDGTTLEFVYRLKG